MRDLIDINDDIAETLENLKDEEPNTYEYVELYEEYLSLLEEKDFVLLHK